MNEPLLLTEAEAAQRLRMSARYLRKARHDGRLHYVLLGRAVRYTIDDLESFVATLRKVNTPCPATQPPAKSNGRRRQGADIIDFTARNAAR